MVSIIIPVFEPMYLIEDCLNSLIQYTTYPDYEIILIDNSNSGGAKDAVSRLRVPAKKEIIIHKSERNYLHVESNNKGIELSHGEWILFLNDDIEIPPDQGHWLSKLIEMFSLYPDCGVSTLVLIHRRKTIYWVGSTRAGHHDQMHTIYDFVKRPPLESPWSNMACALTKREILNAIPYGSAHKDSRFFGIPLQHYGADEAWSTKIVADMKLKNIVCLDTWIYHFNERCVPSDQRKK